MIWVLVSIYHSYTNGLWKDTKCDNESDVIRLSVQVKELCEWREKCDCIFFDMVECKTIIGFSCTDRIYFCFEVPYVMSE